ncbi:MAG TPA: polymer-forming cytoskeletal protein [Candidatus Angelobacter sp.]|nr:polymer-forming cytoskeletal protein [Candidatus Angelobacter sp.]
MAAKWLGGKSGGSSEWAGFIDRGVSIEGKIKIAGMFRVDGHVKGNIASDHGLLLGENAHVEGQIDANDVTIAGRFDGSIFAKERVEIQSKGVVTGEIHSPCLVIQPGGILDGHCHMLSAARQEEPLTIPIRSGSQVVSQA